MEGLPGGSENAKALPSLGKSCEQQKHSQSLGLSGKATSPAQSQAQACPEAPKKGHGLISPMRQEEGHCEG